MGAPVGVLEPLSDALPPLSLAATPRDSEGVDDSEGVEVPARVAEPVGEGVEAPLGGGSGVPDAVAMT